MTISIPLSFAKFLQAHVFSTTMWENGYDSDESNRVCAAMTEWAQRDLGISGEFVIIWSANQGAVFSGDCELAYLHANRAYLLPNPYLEGNAEGFIHALQKIVEGHWSELYDVPFSHRVLYNVVSCV
ncbi:hypothetical protein [Sulfoacidibacillus thermotolerans]|uniref:Uncharacterized protein n=1 Tax=Sulfoacidibacillus thermotolerans TaxID=1765684 RepID=A0A2U3DAQ0_SULT2|nr:hypothetical protein [Sulfoacidibacillus thermotolerans]PWI58357.1 hypothetical protein BM613_03830 [Sulfoacidibacillus thermotolerans]